MDNQRRVIALGFFDGVHLGHGALLRRVAQRAAELDAAGKEELSAIIAGRTAAYISDKADALGFRVTAQVETAPGADGEIPIPVSAVLTGPYSRELADCIAGELGIPAERQVWHEGKN